MSLQQSGNTTQCFLIRYIDTLPCLLFRPKNLGVIPSSVSFIPTPSSPLDLQSIFRISLYCSLVPTTFRQGYHSSSQRITPFPWAGCALRRASQTKSHPNHPAPSCPHYLSDLIPSYSPHAPHSRHSDFLVVVQTHQYIPVPRHKPLLFHVAETLFTQPPQCPAFSSVTSKGSTMMLSESFCDHAK